MSVEDSILKKMFQHKEKDIIAIILFSVIMWILIVWLSLFYFVIDINFIITLLSVEGTLFSIITAAYIFYVEFLDKTFTRTFQTRDKLLGIFGNDEENKNKVKKGLSDEFLNIVFLQYLLAFALLIIGLSLLFSVSTILIDQVMNTAIPRMVNLCLFIWGISLMLIWLLFFGFGNLPSKESYKALIED